jgi:hypothetical protein
MRPREGNTRHSSKVLFVHDTPYGAASCRQVVPNLWTDGVSSLFQARLRHPGTAPLVSLRGLLS